MSSSWLNWLTPWTALNKASANAGGPSYNGGDALGGLKNSIEGNPAAASSGMNALMQQAFTQGNKINQMLQSEKGGSLAYYKPMQQMFGNMYGTGGLMPAKAPGAPGGGMP